MEEKDKGKHRLREGVEIIVDEAKSAAAEAFRRSGAESLGENLRETLQDTLSARRNVVMVRLNKESLARLDDLVEAGVVNSRSEAAAFLIGKGTEAAAGLFDRISDKIEQIRKTKEELREILNDAPGGDQGQDPRSDRQ